MKMKSIMAARTPQLAAKPHVRWCGRVPGRNPRHPTRSGQYQAARGVGLTTGGGRFCLSTFPASR